MFARRNSFFDLSVRVGRLFDIPISLHITILFFLFPIIANRWLGLLVSTEISVGIVLCVLLHELGHALAAKHYRLGGISIMLHGFGGYASASGECTPTHSLQSR